MFFGRMEAQMNNLIVTVFPDDAKADEGLRQTQDLHGEGTVTAYARAVLKRDASGELFITRRDHRGPLGVGIGTLAGGLAAVLGGPVGLPAAVAGGALAGSYVDLLRKGFGDEFIDAVQRDLTPGTSALVAEVSGDSVNPLAARLQALGGKVTWQRIDDYLSGFVEEDTASIRSDLTELSAEHAGRKADVMASKLDLDGGGRRSSGKPTMGE
jgi:uncharacterized membrane protein